MATRSKLIFIKFWLYTLQVNGKPKKSEKPLDSIKSVDPKSFPPCRRVLIEQIKRAWFVAKLYKMATQAYPAEAFAEIDYGWKLSSKRIPVS